MFPTQDSNATATYRHGINTKIIMPPPHRG